MFIIEEIHKKITSEFVEHGNPFLTEVPLQTQFPFKHKLHKVGCEPSLHRLQFAFFLKIKSKTNIAIKRITQFNLII